ncbi:hypothetical protein Tco_1295207 [Tanacetum coccineum]
MFSRFLTTRATSFDQSPLQIMHMLYSFVNNIHVDYADLLWEGLHYSLEHPSTLIPYPRFTKLIVSHYMTAFPEISRRARDKYHNLDDDMMVKNIFNSGKHKDGVGMKFPSWMITDEMKLTENYRLYAMVFGVYVPTNQSQLIESTQRTHRKISAPRSLNPKTDDTESSAPRKSTVIRLRIPQRRSTRLTPPTQIPTNDEADDIILQDTIQLSLAEQKSHDELEAKQNVQKVEEHLIAEEIEKLVEGADNVENVEVDSSTLRQDDAQTILGTRLEPRINKESPKVEITVFEQPINVIKEEEESTEDDYELRRREKGKHVEESRSTPSPTTIRSPRNHFTLISSNTEKLQQLMVTDPPPSSSTPSSFSAKSKISATNRLLSFFKPKPKCFKQYKSFLMNWKDTIEIMKESLPTMLQQDGLPIWLALKYKFERRRVLDTPCRPSAVRLRDQDNPHDDAHLEGENSVKRQKMSKHGTFVFRESSSGQDYESEPGSSTSGNQEQLDDFDFWMDSYATDDDEIPIEKVSQELVNEMLQIVDEAKPRKVNDIVWESTKEIIVTPYPQRPTPVVQSCQRDPKPPALSLVNQDLLYLKKGSSRPEKIMMSLHKFPAVIFSNDDIEERTSRWIFYIKKQKDPGKPKEVVYLNSKIVQIIKTYWELRHERMFITEIVARRVNGSIVSTAESDYKNLNKNDIEDMYLLIVNNKVDDYAEIGMESYQQKVNLTAPTITFPGIEKYKVFSIVSKPVQEREKERATSPGAVESEQFLEKVLVKHLVREVVIGVDE